MVGALSDSIRAVQWEYGAERCQWCSQCQIVPNSTEVVAVSDNNGVAECKYRVVSTSVAVIVAGQSGFSRGCSVRQY
jgi:hypothetical protein